MPNKPFPYVLRISRQIRFNFHELKCGGNNKANTVWNNGLGRRTFKMCGLKMSRVQAGGYTDILF
jgi:hypothetical protein